MESSLLYGSLIEVLRQAADAPGFAGVGAVWITELSRLLPELREKYPNLPSPDPGDPGSRRRFYEAVAQVFEAVAYEQPVFCVLDDLHWADDATLELLHYLARRLCACQVLIVAGIRPGEASGPLKKLQRTLVQEHGGVRLELEPLDEAETHEMVSSMFDSLPIPPSFSSLVWENSKGNPFFGVAMVEALADRGCVRATPERMEWDPECAAEVTRLPHQEKELLDARFDLLSEKELLLLQIGAVSGREFTTGLVAAAAAMKHTEAESGLDSLAARNLIRRRPHGKRSQWEFLHDRILEAVYGSLEEDARATLHAAVAKAGESGASGVEPSSVALHAARAGDRAAAFRYALEAGHWARSVFAFEGARSMYQVAFANAADAEGKAEVQAHIDQLPSRPPDPATAARRGWAGFPVWAWGVFLLILIGLGVGGAAYWIIPDRSPAPLPSGILVRVDSAGVPALGILNTEPGLPPVEPLPEGTMNGVLTAGEDAKLSPDGRWLAQHLGRDGGRPDVYLISIDGSDTLRVTTNPDDDLPEMWFPSGEAVLATSAVASDTERYAYRYSIAFIDGTPAQWIEPEPWADTWWWGGGAAISPDGTQLAMIVEREAQGRSLWIMDADGGNAERIMPVGAEGGGMAFSPDGRYLAIIQHPGTRLGFLDLDSLTVRSIDLQDIAPMDPLLWEEDSERVFFSGRIDGNFEIFGVQAADLSLDRITYSPSDEQVVSILNPHSPIATQVEFLFPATGAVVLASDSMPVRAVVRDQNGVVMEAPSLRLGCEPQEVCRVRGEQVHGLAVGSASLIAHVGGWRADTVAIEVLDPTPSLALEENWERGIDSDAWRSFGSPSPITLPGEGVAGSTGFQANGDDSWSSGVVSHRSFSARRGLTVEFWGRGEFHTPWPTWQWLNVGLTDAEPTEFLGESPVPPIQFYIALETEPEGRANLSIGGMQSPEIPLEEIMDDTSGWHHFALQIFPHGRKEVWLDGELLRAEDNTPPLPPDLRLVVYGRATDGPVIHDDVKVYEGIVYGR